jgi:hypothetical protein
MLTSRRSRMTLCMMAVIIAVFAYSAFINLV